MVVHHCEDSCRQIKELLADEQRCCTYLANMMQLKHDIEENRKSFERVNVAYAD